MSISASTRSSSQRSSIPIIHRVPSPEVPEEPEQVDPSQLLSAYLAPRLTLEEVTNNLLVPIRAALSSPVEAENEKANILLFDLWTSLFDSVAIAPSPDYSTGTPNPTNIAYLSELANLVDAIHDALPTGQFSWFEPEARDRWNFAPTKPPFVQKQIAAWTNLNTFLILVWTFHLKEGVKPVFDFELDAIRSLRLTLETPQKPEVLDALVPAAACWIDVKQSGEKIFKSRRRWEEDGRLGPVARVGPLLGDVLDWEEKDEPMGFSGRRWKFWKKKFVEISELGGVSVETRETAKAAVGVMEKIENSAKT